MTDYALTHLRLVDDVDWAALQTRLEGFAEVVAAEPAFESLRCLRTGRHEAVLVVRCGDPPTTERISNGPARAWLLDQLAPFLAEAPNTQTGELLFGVTRAEDAALAEIEAQTPERRLERFVGIVARRGALWGLYGETWARAPHDDGIEALPFWPRMEFAARCIAEHWSGFAPREISLDEFLEQWLPGMHEDKIRAVVFPTPSHPGLSIAPDELLGLLHTTLEGEDEA